MELVGRGDIIIPKILFDIDRIGRYVPKIPSESDGFWKMSFEGKKILIKIIQKKKKTTKTRRSASHLELSLDP